MLDAEPTPRWRGIFCNRTLNLRGIRAIGYDMDYTLIHYHVQAWERHAFDHMKGKLCEAGYPVEGVVFDQSAVIRGLVIDRKLGNLVKSNRYGYVKAATHGSRTLDFDAWRAAYSRVVVDLSEPRFQFLNTLFGVSEGCMYAQLVDLYDAGRLPGVQGYSDLYGRVRRFLDLAHLEGELKAEIVANPERFVDLDPECPLTLLDQKRAGKKLALITNSGWPYTQSMMGFAFDPFLPDGMCWQDLFDVVIVAARKPGFFTRANPVHEVHQDTGLLAPVVGDIETGRCYFGGHAELVERCLGLRGEQILYVGDHVYGDVHVSKRVRRWRTALILRELEDEVRALQSFEATQQAFDALMTEKATLEHREAQLRLQIQRRRKSYGPGAVRGSLRELEASLEAVREELVALDGRIAPLAVRSGELANPRWGLLMRTGNDKSHMARHVERHADIYTSRVSNLLAATPFAYLRSSRASLPHDG